MSNAAETLQRAKDALGSGRHEDARDLAEAVLQENPNDPNALQIAGISRCQLGDPAGGSTHLAALVDAYPDEPLSRINLGNALVASGQSEAAIEHLQAATQLVPDNPDAWHLLGIAHRDSEDAISAIGAWQQAVTLAPDHAAAANALATATAGSGNPETAETTLRAAADREPTRPTLHYNLGIVLAQQGKFDEAVARFEQTLSLDARNVDAREALAAVCEALGRFDDAAHHLRQGVRRRRDDPELRYKLASVLERNQQHVDATGVLDAALAQWPDHAGLRLVRARIQRRSGDLRGARSAMADLDIESQTAPLRLSLYNEMGRLDDLEGDEASALAAFAASKRAAQQQHDEIYGEGSSFEDRLVRLTDYEPQPGDQSPAADPSTPVFVIGMPRSGTTLLGRVLHAHSALEVLEEVDTVNALANSVDADDGGYPEGLEALSDQRITTLRQQYRAYTDHVREDADTRLVDKMPLNLLDAALINKLYPGAPIIWVIRDPRDIVLSAFMQPFAPSPGMIGFSTLERGAETFDRYGSIWETSRSALDLNVHPVRYESLVTNFDDTVAALLTFLDLEWQDSVREFYENAANIKTASSEQVSLPIYADAVGRWRRYRPWINDAAAALQPWVDRYGYETE